MDTTHEILVKARNLVDSRWNAPWCASNALSKAASFRVEGGVRKAAQLAVLAAAGVEVKQNDWLGATYAWNDAPGRTKAEVLAAFDKAIALTAPAPADPFADERPQAPGVEPKAERSNQKVPA